MVQEMVITLREGGETSLMLALLFSSLKAAGSVAYRISAWIGFAIAFTLSVCAGFLLHDLGALGPLFEASLAWLGAGFIAALAVQLHQSASDHRAALKQLRDSAAAPNASWGTALAIGSFAFVSVIREGLETAVFLSNSPAHVSQGRWLGAGVGLTLAAAFGIAIYLGFRKLNVRSFMKTTEVLLLALVVSLVLAGLHEFREAGLLAFPTRVDLIYLEWFQGGVFLQILLCAAPFLYLLLSRAPARHYVPAVGLASVLALTPHALEHAAKRWEHGQIPPGERPAAARVESAVVARSHALLASLAALRDGVARGNVDVARRSWIDARASFVQIEPYLTLAAAESAEELNGEPGESAGFHGVEETLFAAGAPWTRNPAARSALRADIEDLLGRARFATSVLEGTTYDPARVRAAWSAHRWTMLQRTDGEESGASQTSILEFCATLDALDRDLAAGGLHAAGAAAPDPPSAPIRLALGNSPAQARHGPRFAEFALESRVSDSELHKPLPHPGPDRVWDGIDRAALREAIQKFFTRVDRGRDNLPEKI